MVRLNRAKVVGILARCRVWVVPNEKQTAVWFDPQYAFDNHDIDLQGVLGEDDIACMMSSVGFGFPEFNDLVVMQRWPHAVPPDANIQGGRHEAASGSANPRHFSSLGGPEHVVDGFASVHQFLCMVCGNLNLAGRAKFSSVPEGVVKIWNGLQVHRFEEISPKHKKFVFALLSLFFLDGCVAGHGVDVGGHGGIIAGVRARVGEHFLGHGLDGFGGDTGACRVVHTAGSIAMGIGNNGGLHGRPEAREP